MAYTSKDYKTKKAMIEDLKQGVEILVYQPGPFGPSIQDGSIALEGPHFPEPHRWYASATVEDGVITSVK